MLLRLSAVLSSLDLPGSELHAARLDGELYSVDEGFSPVDEIERPTTRAAALLPLVSSRAIAERRTAAWIWGAAPSAPERHEFCVSLGARVGRLTGARVALREVVIDDEDALDVGGLRVTTPLRTATDIARFSENFGELESAMISKLMVIGRFDAQDCFLSMERRRNLPQKRQARERLQSLETA